MTVYQPREITARLAVALTEMPVVVLTGMRQTGKTTLLQHDPALQGRRYLSLDDFATLEAAQRHPEALLAGALLETYVYQNLAALCEAAWPEAELSYWHVQGRHEVDFIIRVGRDTLAVEVKFASRWSERDLRSLRTFLESDRRCRAGVLAHCGEGIAQLGERLWAIPLGMVLS